MFPTFSRLRGFNFQNQLIRLERLLNTDIVLFFVLLEKVQCPKSKQSSKMRFYLFRFGPSYLLVLVLPVINFGRNHVSLKGSGFASQCGNLTILLLLRFNVKSIWAFLEVQNKPL